MIEGLIAVQDPLRAMPFLRGRSAAVRSQSARESTVSAGARGRAAVDQRSACGTGVTR